MIRKLKTEKICYNIITYNELVLDVKWLERNNFNKISTKDESYSESTIKEIIVTTNSGIFYHLLFLLMLRLLLLMFCKLDLSYYNLK